MKTIEHNQELLDSKRKLFQKTFKVNSIYEEMKLDELIKIYNNFSLVELVAMNLKKKNRD